MRSQLERAINLAANTGDKIIVVDEMNDRSSVVMNLDDYEKLLKGQNKGRSGVKNLTEEELLDKINHDIVSWKDANSDKDFLDEINEDDDDFSPEEDMAAEEADEDDPDFIAPDFDAEGNLVPEEKAAEEPVVMPEEPATAKADEDENVYYYHEPEKTEAEKEEPGFTSIKDEIKKNKKAWAIPEEVKKSAEDVRL
jgi:hypothetical protein